MSNVSSRAASPAISAVGSVEIDPDTVQLTPRSKIKALLAGLDDSEDDHAQTQKRMGPARNKDREETAGARISDPFVEEESEEEDDISIAPKGRLAARLQASEKQITSEEQHDSENDPPIPDKRSITPVSDDEALPAPKTFSRLLKRKRASPTVDSITELNSDRELLRFTAAVDEDNSDKSVYEDESSTKSNRFAALVEKKRAERVAREAAEEAKKAEKAAAHRKSRPTAQVSDIDTEDDDEVGVVLTQKSRPTRKAGKKALEEMARETQRISRNMQLAHEAKTKKKITKESLLARFKPKPAQVAVPASSSIVNSSASNSDVEGASEKQTPLTSPDGSTSKSKVQPNLIPETSNLGEESDEELPSLVEVLAQPLNKGKGKADDQSYEDLHPTEVGSEPQGECIAQASDLSALTVNETKIELKQKPIRLIPPEKLPATTADDSDDGLEVVHSKIFRVFETLPARKQIEGRSSLVQRALAQIHAPNKSAKVNVAPSHRQVEAEMRRKARQQAAAERTERLEHLRNKGVIIRTNEEIQKDQEEVEDLLAKAREEEAELTKREKEAAKKEARANGEEVEESSDDEDYDDKDDDADDRDGELSGSEESESDEDAESDKEVSSDMVDDAASEASDEEEREEEDNQTAEQPGQLDEGTNLQTQDDEDDVPIPQRRRRLINKVVDDDEDDLPEVQDAELVLTVPNDSPIAQNPFGLQAGLSDAPMGLTQAFAATMADSQLRNGLSQEDSLLQLRSMPSPSFANVVPDSIRQETQATLEELDVDLHITQTQIEQDTLPVDTSGLGLTQISEMPDPTQDVGFQNSSPVQKRFVSLPLSTIDTVIIPQDDEAPAKQRGRLVKRKRQAIAAFSDEEDAPEAQLSADQFADEDAEPAQTAFNIMQRAAEKARRKKLRFNERNIDAKEMFEEQAQESEDEYAGLGGASDDSEGEEDEEIRRMIDESEVNVNERKVAAYFAEKEREENEAGIQKLYKDINSGALRRKRGAGADFDDLDDSDDDHAARQARKRREFARMRKALLDGDSNIVKIAEDPKKSAFLRAIEDRDDDEDFDVLESTPREEDNYVESQDVIPDSQAENRPPSTTTRARSTTDSMMPPTKRFTTIDSRRTILGPGKKPTTLADIRASVSFLIEEPDSMFDTKAGPSLFDASSDIEVEEEDIPEDAIGEPLPLEQRQNPRRTGPRSDNPRFVDRLSLKRQESSKDSQTSAGNLAFVDPRFAVERAGFKPPTLLRKATSSFSVFSSQDENGISTNNNAKKAAMEPEVKGRGVGGGSKRSSVNWMAREAERKAALEKKLGTSKATSSIKNRGSGLSNLLSRTSTWE